MRVNYKNQTAGNNNMLVMLSEVETSLLYYRSFDCATDDVRSSVIASLRSNPVFPSFPAV